MRKRSDSRNDVPTAQELDELVEAHRPKKSNAGCFYVRAPEGARLFLDRVRERVRTTGEAFAHPAIAKTLAERWGVKVSPQTVAYHTRGRCGCTKKESQ